MNEIYEIIESKLKTSGFTADISGETVYNDICDQIDGKEDGTYILLSKLAHNIVFEYNLQIMDENFNLSTLTITENDKVYVINFDE